MSALNTSAYDAKAPSLLVFTKSVPADKLEEYRCWQEEGKARGHRILGTESIKWFSFTAPEPDSKSGKLHETVVVMFKEGRDARKWMESKERAQWLEKAEKYDLHQTFSSAHLPLDDGSLGGFLTPNSVPKPTPPPPKWKSSLVVYAALLPTVALFSNILVPALFKALPAMTLLPTGLKMASSLIGSVIFMSWVAMPLSFKHVGHLVMPPAKDWPDIAMRIAKLVVIYGALISFASLLAGDFNLGSLINLLK